MAILRVNKLGTTTSATTGLSSLTLTVGQTTTAGNRIIVGVKWSASDRARTVTDSQGNAYTEDVHLGTAISIFSARADNPLTSGVDWIKVTWTGGTVNNPGMCAYEYSGLVNLGALDQTVSATATSSSIDSGPVTTTVANELVFGLVWWGGNSALTLPAGTELDQVTISASDRFETQERIVSSTGTYNTTGHTTSSSLWLAATATYADSATSRLAVANTTLPAITGSGVVGMQLTCSQGVWTNVPTSYAYQWKRAGSNIVGATSAHYLVTAADIGNVLSCVVSASNKYGPVAATASNTVTPAVNKVQSGMGI